MIKKHIDIFLVLLISIIPLGTLFYPGLPITHDGQDHVARIANFYTSLLDGNLIPRWAGNLNWGYGHPILMFLYPLPSYAASLFHFIGFSLVDSTKLVFAASYILSGITMYLWGKRAFGKIAGVVASILYLYAPYRFIDLYVRGAIGEHVAFIFPPLVLLFLYQVFNSKRKAIMLFGLAFSMAGLILAHNAISLMFLPFIGGYLFYLLWFYKKKREFIESILALIYGFLLSLFFWLPAFVEGKYTLRDIVTGDTALSRFVDPLSLIYGPWSFGGTGQFSVQIGLITWLFILCSPIGIYIYYKKKKKESILYLFTFIVFLGSLFIMLPESEFVWRSVTTLQKFQFPWRFLSVSIFAGAVLAAMLVSLINKMQIKIFILLVVFLFSVFLTKDYWGANGFLQKPESFYAGIYNGTTDTGESAPIWSVRFMEKRPKAHMEVIDGEAKIKEISRSSTRHSYLIDSKYSSMILENTLYFPGWKIYVDGKEYNGIQFQNPAYRGLMTFKVNDGVHNVDVVFQETRLRLIADIISLFAVVLAFAFLIFERFKIIKL